MIISLFLVLLVELQIDIQYNTILNSCECAKCVLMSAPDGLY